MLLRHRQKTIDVISRARQHDWKIAIPAGLITAAALIVGSALGNVHGPAIRPRVVVWSAAAVVQAGTGFEYRHDVVSDREPAEHRGLLGQVA